MAENNVKTPIQEYGDRVEKLSQILDRLGARKYCTDFCGSNRRKSCCSPGLDKCNPKIVFRDQWLDLLKTEATQNGWDGSESVSLSWQFRRLSEDDKKQFRECGWPTNEFQDYTACGYLCRKKGAEGNGCTLVRFKPPACIGYICTYMQEFLAGPRMRGRSPQAEAFFEAMRTVQSGSHDTEIIKALDDAIQKGHEFLTSKK